MASRLSFFSSHPTIPDWVELSSFMLATIISEVSPPWPCRCLRLGILKPHEYLVILATKVARTGEKQQKSLCSTSGLLLLGDLPEHYAMSVMLLELTIVTSSKPASLGAHLTKGSSAVPSRIRV